MTTYKVGIFGSYGYWNQGDEAILESILTQLRAALPVEITVFTRNVDYTNRLHQVEHAVPFAALTRDELRPHVEALDLLIVGGGGILFDQWARINFGVEALAMELNIPIMVYAVGAGPLEEEKTIQQVQALLQAARVVTVRDRAAKQLLEKRDVTREITVTADAALLLQPAALPDDLWQREGIDRGRPLVGISLREPGEAAPGLEVERYHSLVASAADFVVERFGARLLYIPMEPRTADLQHSHAVIAQMRHPEQASVLAGEYTPGQILTLMQHLSLAVGMRLHFLIFAAMQQVPFVALPYASKVNGFIEGLGLEMPPLDQISIGQFLAYVDKTWDHQDEIKAQIAKALSPLREKSKENNAMAVELLKSL